MIMFQKWPRVGTNSCNTIPVAPRGVPVAFLPEWLEDSLNFLWFHSLKVPPRFLNAFFLNPHVNCASLHIHEVIHLASKQWPFGPCAFIANAFITCSPQFGFAARFNQHPSKFQHYIGEASGCVCVCSWLVSPSQVSSSISTRNTRIVQIFLYLFISILSVFLFIHLIMVETFVRPMFNIMYACVHLHPYPHV